MLGADVLGDNPARDNLVRAGEILSDHHRVHVAPLRGGERARIIRHGFECRLEVFPTLAEPSSMRTKGDTSVTDL